MKPISDIGPIVVGPHGWTQAQVELVRTKLIELARGVNQFVALSTSTAIRVLSGELGNSPVAPRGMTKHVFTNAATAEEVAHGLDSVPTGYIVIRRYPSGTVADAALSDWNRRTVWLQSNLAGLSVTLLFF